MPFSLSDFDFEFPEELVAHQPLAERDASRLLVLDADRQIKHCKLADLPDVLPKNALIIANDTRVIPARIMGRFPTGGKFEIMLLKLDPATSSTSECTWDAVGRPLQKILARKKISLPAGLQAIIAPHPNQPRFMRVTFDRSADQLAAWLGEHGFMPLPPYIKRDDPKPAHESTDADRYQTVYASAAGSVAAPTAGLHFTDPLIERLLDSGIEFVPITLHVGGGTFLPVQTETVGEHRMHSESYFLSEAAVTKIMQAMSVRRPIVAIGTTSFRAIESYWERYGADGRRLLAEADKWHQTELFIYPKDAKDKYEPNVIEYLITNFHQPKSTLFMLICALVGYDVAKQMYKEAIASRYRLFSYGDASLLSLED